MQRPTRDRAQHFGPLLLSTLLLGLAPLGCSGPVDDTGQSATSSELIGAPEDTTHPFDVGVCQGALNTDPAKGPIGTCRSGTAKCSGTLIAPNLVLTARHCVANAVWGPDAATNPCDGDFTTDVVLPGGTRVTTSDSVFVGTPKWYDVSEILVPPGSTRFCEADVALLVLASNVPSSEARYVGVNYRRNIASWSPRSVAIVGRGGVDETFELDANGDWTGGDVVDRGDLERRIAEKIPFSCASDTQACTFVDHEVPTTHVFTAALRQFLIGPGAASGDSGAGVFDQLGFRLWNGRYASVLGVATWNFIGPDGKPNGAGAQRLDAFADFLEQGALHARQLGGYRLPWWLIVNAFMN